MGWLNEFKVRAESVSQVGAGLERPETALAAKDGSVWVCDMRGFVHIAPDGLSQRVYELSAAACESADAVSIPNGFAFTRAGRIAFADFGCRHFGEMALDGKRNELSAALRRIPTARPNFVLRDSRNEYWLLNGLDLK